jgi:hypothetical protein
MMKSLPPRCLTLMTLMMNNDADTYDQYVGAQVRVPIGGEIRSGKVMRRKRELDGTWKRRAKSNPMLIPELMKLSSQMGAVMNTLQM